jgi:hypothetical protein
MVGKTIGVTVGEVTILRSTRDHPEQRRLSRFVAVDFDVTSSVVDVVLRELNSRGMSVEARRPLRVGASYPFKIRNGREFVSLTGEVRWCRLLRMIDIGGGESQALYRAGIAFSESFDDFLPPVESISSKPKSSSTSSTRIVTRRKRQTASQSCPDCKAVAVAGQKRCRICGLVLPQ